MNETSIAASERFDRRLELERQRSKQIDAYIKRVNDLLAVYERQGLIPRKIDPFILVKMGRRTESSK